MDDYTNYKCLYRLRRSYSGLIFWFGMCVGHIGFVFNRYFFNIGLLTTTCLLLEGLSGRMS